MPSSAEELCVLISQVNVWIEASALTGNCFVVFQNSIEFTLSIPSCIELIAQYSKRPGLIVGGGTVLNTEQVE